MGFTKEEIEYMADVFIEHHIKQFKKMPVLEIEIYLDFIFLFLKDHGHEIFDSYYS